MLEIRRNILELLEKSKKSLLLLGPRQTGKSTLIADLKPDLKINLADETEYVQFAKNPAELMQRLEQNPKVKTVFIDEVQRLPSLLNNIQVIIDNNNPPRKFYLTGSSARKLRRGQANLLPGRIFSFSLGPLVASEIGGKINLREVLSTGTLPGVFVEDEVAVKEKILRTYAATYLKEEIQAEALTRNLEGFTRFLFVAAASTTLFLDIAKLAEQALVPYQSAKRYFEILEDTLIVHRIQAFSKSDRRRLIQHPRFFFFDNGILNGLLENFSISEDRKGMLFENFIVTQIIHGAASKDIPVRLSTYRTEGGAEVDLIVELNSQTWAIEIKSAEIISRPNLSGLKSFKDFYKGKCKLVLTYAGSVAKKIEDIEVMPWPILLKELGF